MALVAAGGTIIYLATNVTVGSRVAAMPYLVIAFGFLVGVAGLVLLFRDIDQPGIEPVGFDPERAASDAERVLGQLGMNYDILRQQTKIGFILAALFMALGISVILAGSAGELLGYTAGTSGITAIAAIIIESISIIGFYLFRISFKELTATSERLHGMLLLLDAFKRAETLPKEQKTEVMMTLIQQLVDYGRDHQSAARAQTG